MNETGNDFLPILSSVPGPRGPKGDPGSGSAGAAGRSAYTLTTAVFTVPARGGAVGISVGDTAMFAVGLSIFVETAGYYQVTAIPNATTLTLYYLDIPVNTQTGVIPAGKKVVASGPSFIDSGAVDDLASRVYSLEATPLGNRNFYAAAAPAPAGLKLGDNWFDTDDGYKHYRWDGTAWAPANRILDQADFGTGIRPIVKVTSLPATGYADGDFVWLQTDGKLYRRKAGAWTAAVATGDLEGEIDGTKIVNGTLVAQKLAANSVTADKVGANQIITHAANIGEAVITDAHCTTLSAGRVTAGDIQAVNFGYAGRIFHPGCYDAAGTAATATAAISGGQVSAITVTGQGSGYTETSHPAVSLTGGGGSGARAVAVVEAGKVTRVVLTHPGVGYTSAPTVTIAQHKSFRYFSSVEMGTSAASSKIFGTGSGFGFSQAAPVVAYGPGHPSWGLGGAPTMCPSGSGVAKVHIQARLIKETGDLAAITVYCRVNGGAAQPLASVPAQSTSHAILSAMRLLGTTFTPLAPTDSIALYVAPCDGTGALSTATTCRYELDVTFFNW